MTFEQEFEKEYSYNPCKKYLDEVAKITKEYQDKSAEYYRENHDNISKARQNAFDRIMDDVLMLRFKNEAQGSMKTGAKIVDQAAISDDVFLTLFEGVDRFVRGALFRAYKSDLFSYWGRLYEYHYFEIKSDIVYKSVTL